MSIEELNRLDRFATQNGIALQADGATATMVVEERHLNGANVCQGGALFTLADLAAAGLTRGEKLTIDSHIHYLRASKLGDRLTAQSYFVRDGRLSLIRTDIRNQDNVLVATVDAGFILPRMSHDVTVRGSEGGCC